MLGFGHLALRQSFNTKLTLTVLLITFSQFNFGFDQQGFSATQAMNAFQKQFGVYNAKSKTYRLNPAWVSYFNGFIYLGQAFGVVVGSYISKRFGRRMYIYIGMELAVVPIFQSEITPKQARGFIVGTYQISLFFGGLVMNIIARGTQSITTKNAYIIPYGLFYVVPSIVALSIWFVPESPRWLILKNRHEDAMQELRKLRQGKYTDSEIEEEFRDIVQRIEIERQQGSFFDIFRKANLRRTIIVVGANFFLQATGQNFTSNYGALFAKSLGTINPFSVTVMLGAVNTTTAFLAMVPQVMFGAVIQMASCLTMGGLGTAANPSDNIKAGIIAMMVVFTFGYSIGWAPTAHILSAEIPSTSMRDMTYRTASVLNIAVQFAVSFSLPYLLDAPYADLGSKVGFIFGSIAAVSVVFAFFCVPNVARRSLEDIDRLFASGIPIGKFGSAKLDDSSEDIEIGTDRKDVVD
ncbi:Major facilitator superfamily domain, general substrate transporter [Penicillium occitanis (nom. inval.)]|nr:Major facilitator superfamily domain, general substrate transporter [Penicillium occitanis (nom. inval.)]PCH07015.1 hypothetical protein PENOC_021200 [Penicillium occitanis (nom. inval.)]